MANVGDVLFFHFEDSQPKRKDGDMHMHIHIGAIDELPWLLLFRRLLFVFLDHTKSGRSCFNLKHKKFRALESTPTPAAAPPLCCSLLVRAHMPLQQLCPPEVFGIVEGKILISV